MAIFLNSSATGVILKIATVDLSAYVKSISVNQSFDEVEVTAMGATAHQFAPGLYADSLDVELLNDFAAAKVYATLKAAIGTTVAVTVQQTSATTSATNPLFSSTILVNNLAFINGAPGDYSSQTIHFTCNSKWVITES